MFRAVRTIVLVVAAWYALCLLFSLVGININSNFFSPLGVLSMLIYFGIIYILTTGH